MIHCPHCGYYYADEFNFGHCPKGCHEEMMFTDNEDDD